MSVLTQFSGGRTIAAITNYASAGSVKQTLPGTTPEYINGKRALSGALTANTLATALNITGRGALNYAHVSTEDGTGRTVRMKITIDGVSVFDATSSTTNGANQGIVGAGWWSSAGNSGGHQPVLFYTSCLVQIASSLTETDKISSCVNYEVDV